MNHNYWRGAAAALGLLAISGCNSPQPPTDSGAVPEPMVESPLPADEGSLPTLYDQGKSLDLCDGFFQPEVAQAASRVYGMGDRALVELVCAQAAYQAVYAYALYRADGSWQPLTLDVFAPDETGNFARSSQATVGGLSEFDPEQGLLTVFSKARGLGDCGSLADYRWQGNELELATFRYLECSDSPGELVDPADYPQVYP